MPHTDAANAKWTARLVDAVLAGRMDVVLQERMDELLRWLSDGDTPDARAVAAELVRRGIASDEARDLGLSLLDRFLFADDDDEPYRLLGLQRGAGGRTLQTRYHRLIQLYHPDRATGDQAWLHDRTERLNRAYSQLKRRERDRPAPAAAPAPPPTAYSRYATDQRDAYPDSGSVLRRALGSASQFQVRFFGAMVVLAVLLLGYVYLKHSSPAPIAEVGPAEAPQAPERQPVEVAVATNQAMPPAAAEESQLRGGASAATDKDRAGATVEAGFAPAAETLDEAPSVTASSSPQPSSGTQDSAVDTPEVDSAPEAPAESTLVGAAADVETVALNSADGSSAPAAAPVEPADDRRETELPDAAAAVTDTPAEARGPGQAEAVVDSTKTAAATSTPTVSAAQPATVPAEKVAAAEEAAAELATARSAPAQGTNGGKAATPTSGHARPSVSAPRTPPAKPRVVAAAKPPAPLPVPLRPEDARALVERYARALDQGRVGDLTEVLADTVTQDGKGATRAEVVRSLEDVASGAVDRSYALAVGLLTAASPARLRVDGSFRLRYAYADGSLREGRGPVTFTVEREDGQPRITGISRAPQSVSRTPALTRVRVLLGEYSETYQRGDIEGFLDLFTPDAVDNGTRGMAALRDEYATLFADTTARRLDFDVVKATVDDGRHFAVDASFDVALSYKRGSNIERSGDIRIWFEDTPRGLRVSRMEY